MTPVASSAPGDTPLPRDFYARPPIEVAHELLGAVLTLRRGRQVRSGRIVEVEAYLGPHDRAAHSARGRTARTEVMFGPAGMSYVYLIYGIHCCMNVVTGQEGEASAVLIRALEPINPPSMRTNGPGLLCAALGIDRRHNALDLTQAPLYISAATQPVRRIVRAQRIGVDYAGHWARRLLRFYDADSSSVSRR